MCTFNVHHGTVHNVLYTSTLHLCTLLYTPTVHHCTLLYTPTVHHPPDYPPLLTAPPILPLWGVVRAGVELVLELSRPRHFFILLIIVRFRHIKHGYLSVYPSFIHSLIIHLSIIYHTSIYHLSYIYLSAILHLSIIYHSSINLFL